MLNSTPFAALAVLAVLSPGYAAAQADEARSRRSAQAPQLFEIEAEPGQAPTSYFGEEAHEGTLSLTAWNGFFDAGSFLARGERPAPETERPFIGKHFDYLQVGKKPGAARWHLWTPARGHLDVTIFLNVPESESGTIWHLDCGDQRQSVRATPSDGEAAQRAQVQFEVAPGRRTLRLTPEDARAVTRTQVLGLEVAGRAAQGAKLLRARWRPAAVHTSYTSSTCGASDLWVFESRSLNGASSYSPINTPFGYFGTTFDASSMEPRGFNFSMWATGRGKAVPALKDMPHLIATGHPQAEFSGFGHEGSGVKLRGWECLDWNPASVVQALRTERRGGRDYYYGYFFHEPMARWVLYAVGARPPRRRNAAPGFDKVTAFCEVPGPPQRQRTGDVERRIARRGWFLGKDHVWHAADLHACKDRQASSSRRIAPAEDGWHVSVAGGMEIVEGAAMETLPASHSRTLPSYLAQDKVQQLYHVPVRFGTPSVSDLGSSSATIEVELDGLGKDATARLYYGTTDCLTFVPRELHGTEKKGASAELYTDARTWAHHTAADPAADGLHRFELNDLAPGTTYYYRAFVSHAGGKSWSYESDSFTTAR